MNRVFLVLMIVLGLAACKDKSTLNLSDPLQSGRGFIEESLKGNYDEAKKYMATDSTNMDYLERLKDFYKKMDQSEKEGLKNANIIINGTENVSDSVVIMNYSNTYKKIPSKIKLIKVNNEWRVDFKYTFSGNL
jgi:hypothetical protein